MKKEEIIKNVSTTFSKVSVKLKKHSPEILVVAGVVGTVASAVMACHATTKLDSVLEKSKKDIDAIHKCAENEELAAEYSKDDAKKDLTIVYVQAGVKVAKLYAPAVALGTLSIASIVASHNILKKRNVALAAAYATVDKTFKEYRKYIEKDSALERRFQPVTVNEPTIDETVEVLNGIAKYYESYHRVHISPEMIRLCAVLAERYITDRFLPDKAIDLLDESCACTNLRSPEIEAYDTLMQKKEELEQKEKALEDETEINYEELAQVKGERIRLDASIEEAAKKLDDVQVTSDDLSKVIELWTGIPAHKIAETEFTKLANLEDRLKSHIIGQDEAVDLLAKAIKRTRVQLSPRRRPASFIFVGPTGVGKTELVKVLAEELFDSNEPLIRLDMTEFMEKHSVSRIIGSPPGYVGYDEAGQLTEKVRRRPYSVVLFDEIEKAHPDVMNLLLQILDEGKINDAQGRTVNFENTVICMTSNAGSGDKTGETGFNRTIAQMSRDKSIKALGEFLRPEFMSRVDEIVTFAPLSPESLKRIAALMLGEYKEPLAAKGIGLSWTEAALALLCEKAKGGKFGARDLRRVIRKEVEDAIAGKIISGEPLTAIEVDTQDGDIVLHC